VTTVKVAGAAEKPVVDGTVIEVMVLRRAGKATLALLTVVEVGVFPTYIPTLSTAELVDSSDAME
jgi:hypothetical protein